MPLAECMEGLCGLPTSPAILLVFRLGVPAPEKDGRRLIAYYARGGGAHLAEIGRLIEAGVVFPVVGRVYPLEETRDALLQSRSGHVGGKIVIRLH